MTTSGSVDFSLSASEIIEEAYALLRVGADGESLTSAQTTRGRKYLSMMLKSWEADGLRLWCKTEGMLFLDADTAKYDFQTSATSHSCLVSDFVGTQLSADASSGASTITVDSISGISNGDYIGVELEDGSMQWTTVNGAPSGSTITLTATLTDDADTDGYVYTYTTKCERPLKLLQARRTSDLLGTPIDLPMRILERPEYFELTNKSSSSTPLQVYHDPQLNVGYFYLWPTPSDETEVIRFTFSRRIEDVDTLANTMDVPQEWLEAIIWNLAARLSFHSSSPPMDERAGLIAVAQDMKDKLDGWDREYGSVSFSPDYQGFM